MLKDAVKPPHIVIFMILLWVVVTNSFYGCLHPEKASTEIFEHLPKSILLQK